jgi:hypothetical protein
MGSDVILVTFRTRYVIMLTMKRYEGYFLIVPAASLFSLRRKALT